MGLELEWCIQEVLCLLLLSPHISLVSAMQARLNVTYMKWLGVLFILIQTWQASGELSITWVACEQALY